MGATGGVGTTMCITGNGGGVGATGGVGAVGGVGGAGGVGTTTWIIGKGGGVGAMGGIGKLNALTVLTLNNKNTITRIIFFILLTPLRFHTFFYLYFYSWFF